MAGNIQCKNCEESFSDSFNYCPYCGQETADNLTFGVLFSNTISNYFSIDARFFKSILPLMTRPGVLARHFVDGKRLSYLHPAQFYLFISVVFFFIFSFTVREADNKVSKALEKGFDSEVSSDSLSMEMGSVDMEAAKEVLKKNQKHTGMSDEKIEAIDSVYTGTQSIPVSFNFHQEKLDSLIASGAPQAQKLQAMGMNEDAGVFVTKVYAQLLKLYEQRGGGILKALYDTIPFAMFIMLPLFALLLKVFYWKRGTFAHHMVFSFYYFTFLFTTFSLLILAHTFFDIPQWVNTLVFLFLIVYFILALHHFYESRWVGAFFKANFISFLYMLIVLPIAMVGVIFVSFMLY